MRVKSWLQRALLTAWTALLFAAPSHTAQAVAKDVDPKVWVLKDDDTTIYLFGTIHLLDGKTDWFNDEVKTAFDASNELVLEALMPDDPSKLRAVLMKYAANSSGKPWSDKLSADTRAGLDKEINVLGLKKMALDAMDPWFFVTTLTMVRARTLGISGEAGPEETLRAAAKASGKKQDELEGAEAQFAILDSLPMDQQLMMLDDMVKQQDSLKQTFTAMISAWGKGDEKALAAMMNRGLTPEVYKTLLVDRNAKWADRVVARLKSPGTVFVAVGAGHLAGNDNLRSLLEARGFKVRRFRG